MLINIQRSSVTISYITLICRYYSARNEENKSQRSKPKSNHQKKVRKTHHKMWTKAMYLICSQKICKHVSIHCRDGWKQLQNNKTLKQSGKGTEPIPWSPIIRCARPWRETRAESAINKGAWEGRLVTVTKMFSARHLVYYETCLYHRCKLKSILSTTGWNALGHFNTNFVI